MDIDSTTVFGVICLGLALVSTMLMCVHIFWKEEKDKIIEDEPSK